MDRLLAVLAYSVGLVACGRIDFDPGAPCFVAAEPSRVSAYTFADATALGRDAVGPNHLTMVLGTPQRSTDVPPGFAGYSVAFDGASGLCAASVTLDPTRDHTLCWWSKMSALAEMSDQFVNTCSYDTWTSNGGADYEWRINNCNGGVASNLEVPGVYAVDRWVHLCQTYVRASLARTVYVDGDVATPHVQADTDPIIQSAPPAFWCLGEFAFDPASAGGPMHGLLYAPIWFSRVLSTVEIARVHDQTCSVR